jgi:hypothetical protein
MEQVSCQVAFWSFNEANTSSRQMMIMIDEPTKRYMCSVTLFLLMALADGVSDGIGCSSDMASLCSHQWSGSLGTPSL